MNKLIYTSDSPNTRKVDLFLNLKLLFQPWSFLKGSCEKKIAAYFTTFYKSALGTYTFNYARSGMYVLFRSLNLPPNSEVLVEGFTCSSAVNPILWTDLKVTYVDIDPQTGNMDITDLKNKITEKTKAIMFQHTFGNSSGIDEVVRICAEKNIILVEDCTNTILGKHENTLVGTYGHFSIFSFGRDKAVSGVNGGVILINRSEFITNFENLYSTLSYPAVSLVIKDLLYSLFWWLIRFTYNLKIGKLIHVILVKTNILTKASTAQEKMGIKPNYIPAKLPNSLACLVASQLDDIKIFNDHRLKINAIYEKELNHLKEVQSFSYKKGNVLLRYPLLVEDKTALLKYLKRKNILVGDWYSEPITPTINTLDTFNYKVGMCPKSEQVCKKVVNLPNHINIMDKDALTIVAVIKKFYGYKGDF